MRSLDIVDFNDSRMKECKEELLALHRDGGLAQSRLTQAETMAERREAVMATGWMDANTVRDAPASAPSAPVRPRRQAEAAQD